MSYDVFGMCNALYDIQAEVSDALLAEIDAEVGLAKGTMGLIDADQQQAILSKVAPHIVNAESGGSGANTMIGVAMLGGLACYASKVGNDEHGTLYRESLEEKQVGCSLASGDGVTGLCAVLISPDAERTMGTYLGIARELTAEDVDEEGIRNSKYLYVTCYLWDTDGQKAAVLKAMRTARAGNVKVALSLSDPFCVNRHRDDFLQIAREHVDLLIGNDEEAMALTGAGTPREAIQAMAAYCDLAVVTMGGRGSLLREGDRIIEVPAQRITPVDTTGAGDMYAAGILYGLTHNLSLETTGRLASYVAAEVVAQLGPRIDSLDRVAVERIIAKDEG